MDDKTLLQLADLSKAILVVGEIKLNIIVTCSGTKIAAEAPIPVYHESETTYTVAGAANVAKNIKALGIEVDLVSLTNSEDKHLNKILEYELIRSEHLIPVAGYIPESVTRYFDNGFQVFQSRKTKNIEEPIYTENVILEKCKNLLAKNQYSAIILIDNGPSVITKSFSHNLVGLANSNGIPILVNTNMDGLAKFRGADKALIDVCFSGDEKSSENVVKETKTARLDALRNLCRKHDIRDIYGLVKTNNSHFELVNVQLREPVFTMSVAAYDLCLNVVEYCFLAAIGAGLSCNLSQQKTWSLASVCASYISRETKKGIINLADILSRKVIQTTHELENIVKNIPEKDTVVLTTGCFDLFHSGHVYNLKKAKELGDILIVLLNTDMSVKALKGPERPVYNTQERLKLLLAVRHVDYVVLFDEYMPYRQTEIINPDIFVKGHEYTEEQIRKKFPFLKRYRTIPSLDISSTTKTIERIKQ